MLGLCCCLSFSLVAVSGGYSSLQCVGFSMQWLPFFQRMGSRVLGLEQLQFPGLWSTGLIVVVHGLSCSVACGIFPDQGSNPCLLHWQVGSLPLSYQGSPCAIFELKILKCIFILTLRFTGVGARPWGPKWISLDLGPPVSENQVTLSKQLNH